MASESFADLENRNNPSYSNGAIIAPKYPSPWILILAIPVLLTCLSISIQNWGQVFDDSYISYRYAQNLAMGYGITWNPGYPPTEGYTNFLLVVILAPAILAGLDPLLVTRILSFICATAMSGLLFALARRHYDCSATTAAMIASLIFIVPATIVLSLIGLETVVYAFFLLIAFIAGVTFIQRQEQRLSIQFSCLLFLTMLLRPEAALLYPVILIASVTAAIRHKYSLRPVIVGFVTLSVLCSVYLAWKYLHFGQLLPNPYYLKAAGRTLFNQSGLRTIKSFLIDYDLLLMLAIASLVLIIIADPPVPRWNKIAALLGTIFVVVYCFFFSHVDTLMNIYGRFLYPLVPIIILLANPILAKVLGRIEHVDFYKLPVLPAIIIVFLLLFGSTHITNLDSRIKHLSRRDHPQAGEFLMQKEYRLAKALASFPNIKEVRIAFADSGVIPYFSGAIWLDVTGLNDGFLARSHVKEKQINYFFDWSADLVIHPGRAGLSWLQNGHGPLGDYMSWSDDPRWDKYAYVGTSNIKDTDYDMQFFVRKSSPFRGALEGYLKSNIVDGWYDPFPLPIGTYYPKDTQPTWRPR